MSIGSRLIEVILDKRHQLSVPEAAAYALRVAGDDVELQAEAHIFAAALESLKWGEATDRAIDALGLEVWLVMLQPESTV